MTRGTDKSGLKSAGLPEKPSRKGHGHRAAEDDMEQRQMDADDTITAGDNPSLMGQNPNIGKMPPRYQEGSGRTVDPSQLLPTGDFAHNLGDADNANLGIVGRKLAEGEVPPELLANKDATARPQGDTDAGGISTRQ